MVQRHTCPNLRRTSCQDEYNLHNDNDDVIHNCNKNTQKTKWNYINNCCRFLQLMTAVESLDTVVKQCFKNNNSDIIKSVLLQHASHVNYNYRHSMTMVNWSANTDGGLRPSSSSSLFTPALLRTHSFVFFAVHKTPQNLSQPVHLKVFILSECPAFTDVHC